MYIENLDKSNKRPLRGLTPKTPLSDIGPKSTRNNLINNARIVSSYVLPATEATATSAAPAELTTTSFGVSPPPKKESRLF